MGTARQAGDGRAAQAAQRTLDVLEFFEGQSAPVPAAEIAAACGIPRSSLYNLLRMLRARGYIAYRRSDGGWVCGQRLLDRRGYGFPFADGLTVAEVIAAASRGLTTADVAGRSSLPPEAVAGILVALAQSDMVTSGADGTWSVGPRLVALESLFGWTARLRAVARPILARLRDASGETASLVVQDGDDVLYLDQVESLFELRCGGWAGRRVSRFGTSAGAAFDDPANPHLVADAVEPGVTAITCAAAGISPAVGVNVIGPTWRMAERGIDELVELVRAAAADLAAAYAPGGATAR